MNIGKGESSKAYEPRKPNNRGTTMLYNKKAATDILGSKVSKVTPCKGGAIATSKTGEAFIPKVQFTLSYMTDRKERGLQLVKEVTCIRKTLGMAPEEQYRVNKYAVTMRMKGGWKRDYSCTCPDYENSGQHCKHIYAVQAFQNQQDQRINDDWI